MRIVIEEVPHGSQIAGGRNQVVIQKRDNITLCQRDRAILDMAFACPRIMDMRQRNVDCGDICW